MELDANHGFEWCKSFSRAPFVTRWPESPTCTRIRLSQHQTSSPGRKKTASFSQDPPVLNIVGYIFKSPQRCSSILNPYGSWLCKCVCVGANRPLSGAERVLVYVLFCVENICEGRRTYEYRMYVTQTLLGWKTLTVTREWILIQKPWITQSSVELRRSLLFWGGAGFHANTQRSSNWRVDFSARFRAEGESLCRTKDNSCSICRIKWFDLQLQTD